MKDSQIEVFKHIARLNQTSLKNFLSVFLRKYYPKGSVVNTTSYLYAIGTIPIALVAHLDTVHKKTPTSIYFDQKERVLWTPQGLGADDRAGVFAIMSIVASGVMPHVIFCTDEEIGGLGAYKLSKRSNPFKDLRYMIELDRSGVDDCVFYNCENLMFQHYIEQFGFVTDWGTYSDICELCPAWRVPGVNLSVGYFYEHTSAEFLAFDILLNTIDKVKLMLAQKDIPTFKYTTAKKKQFCASCNKYLSPEDLFPVKGEMGDLKYYCPDCVSDDKKCGWCLMCNMPFEKTESCDSMFCPECRETIYYD